MQRDRAAPASSRARPAGSPGWKRSLPLAIDEELEQLRIASVSRARAWRSSVAVRRADAGTRATGGAALTGACGRAPRGNRQRFLQRCEAALWRCRACTRDRCARSAASRCSTRPRRWRRRAAPDRRFRRHRTHSRYPSARSGRCAPTTFSARSLSQHHQSGTDAGEEHQAARRCRACLPA